MRATASAAATVANLGPGFDVLGLCLEGPRDVVTAEITHDGVISIVEIKGDGGRLSHEADKNCVGVVARCVRDWFGDPSLGVRLWLEKGLPLGSGMGSSGASSVAAAVATAAAIDPDLPRAALLDACREGERLATGSPHPDNVAPSLLGGLVACLPAGGDAVEVLRLPLPAGLDVTIVKPGIAIETAAARGILPDAVPMADVVHNLAAMAGLVTALATDDLELIRRCLDDRVATPYRKQLIPGYDEVVAAALGAGVLGAGISGSGPTIFALSASRKVAMAAAEAMVDAFDAFGGGPQAWVSPVDPFGARVSLE